MKETQSSTNEKVRVNLIAKRVFQAKHKLVIKSRSYLYLRSDNESFFSTRF